MSTPAAEIRSFAATIPANTPQSAPVIIPCTFPVRTVLQVNWQVPPGPSGLMGWRLTMSGGNAVMPTGGAWIVADDRSGEWPVQGMPDSGAWEVSGYNTDIYPHTVYVDFLLSVTGPPAAAPAVQLAAPADLAPVPDALPPPPPPGP